jgi:threonine dehydratase
MKDNKNKIPLKEIVKAQKNIKNLVKRTPLIKMPNYSERFGS